MDGMLDGMTPEQFEEWCAKDEVEPIGHATRMLGLIAYLITAHMSGDESEIDPLEFMPWEKNRPTKGHDNEAARRLVGMLGGRHGKPR